jgi:surface protein
MKFMFYHANIFNNDISNWNITNVNDLSRMFCNTNDFNQNLTKWNISKNTNISGMFKNSSIQKTNKPLRCR